MTFRSEVQREIAHMSPGAAIDYLLDIITDLMDPTISTQRMDQLRQAGFDTRPQALLVLWRLAAAKGNLVGSDQLLEMLEEHSGGSDLDPKVVAVTIHRLRKLLPAHGMRIENSWGRGYRLVTPAGYVWPWEDD